MIRDSLRHLRKYLFLRRVSFSPDIVLISAGMDACNNDGLARMRMSVEGFSVLASIVKSIAKESCGGKVAAVLEGGYDLELLSHSVAEVLDVFMGKEVENTTA